MCDRPRSEGGFGRPTRRRRGEDQVTTAGWRCSRAGTPGTVGAPGCPPDDADREGVDPLDAVEHKDVLDRLAIKEADLERDRPRNGKRRALAAPGERPARTLGDQRIGGGGRERAGRAPAMGPFDRTVSTCGRIAFVSAMQTSSPVTSRTGTPW